MDKNSAAFLLSSLLERAQRDGTVSVSNVDISALSFAINLLKPDLSAQLLQANNTIENREPEPEPQPEIKHALTAPAPTNITPTIPTIVEPHLLEVELNLTANQNQSKSNWLLCLDFGTAMSKAFATGSNQQHLDLELGTAAGKSGHTVPSSIFISDSGKVFFGFDAIERSQGTQTGRVRLDSIKEWLSLRIEGDLDDDNCVLSESMNPTKYRLTQGDLIRIYLAFLTDMAEIAMVSRGVDESDARFVQRRFARPCWSDPRQTEWVDREMRKMLAEAQILADTFKGRWQKGVTVQEFFSALSQIKQLNSTPLNLIQNGVPEAVAVAAAGAFIQTENIRDVFMVVDVGAGTTDFGLFITLRDNFGDLIRVFQVPGSIQGMKQAGNKVDQLLRGFILTRERIDASDIGGQMIVVDLSKKIRLLKEALFKNGQVEYVLANDSSGTITLDAFLNDVNVRRFAQEIDLGFNRALNGVDRSYFQWMHELGLTMHIVLTGGGAQLPMIQSLAAGYIEIQGFMFRRELMNSMPDWFENESEELKAVYPQLAVVVGGAETDLPETANGPIVIAAV